MNTAIAQMMIFVNDATSAATLPREIVDDLPAPALALRPAPLRGAVAAPRRGRAHRPRRVAELGPRAGASTRPITIVVQVNGKKRDELQVSQGHRQGRARAARAGLRERAEVHRRQGTEEGHRRSRAVGEYRRIELSFEFSVLSFELSDTYRVFVRRAETQNS